MERHDGSRPHLLIVGCGHWSNPGKDAVTIEYDDMRAPARQRQIEDVAERLASYRPTKVALEVMPDHEAALNEEYRRYCGGAFALSANERHQLGFRLAARMDHGRIFGIDWHDPSQSIPWDDAIDFALGHGQADLVAVFTRSDEERQAEARRELQRLRATSVRDQLLELNSDASLATGNEVYMNLARVGENGNYIGADVVLRWYERNLKIFANLARLIDTAQDRILLVIGNGHRPPLTHFALSSGTFMVDAAATFLAESRS